MEKVIGSHKVGTTTTAVLECGHEVPYSAVKWPDGEAECTKRHDDAPLAITSMKEKDQLA